MIFSKNNIDFRQVSSNAQANFLKSKSFVLTEITSKGSWAFSSTAKEYILQSYRVWTAWLFDLEEYIVHCGNRRITDEMLTEIQRKITKSGLELERHTKDKSEWYDEKFLKVIHQVRDLKIGTMRNIFQSQLRGLMITTAYNEIVGLLINYMNHLMFNVHEIDYLLYCNRNKFRPFVYIDNTDVNLYMSTQEFFPSGRLELYQSLGLMDATRFNIKLSISPEYLSNNFKVEEAYRDLLLKLRTHDAKVCCVV